MREAHAHIAAHGREKSQLNLSACRSSAECLSLLAAEAARLDAANDRGWLVANGVRVEAWTDAAWPSMGDLDRACPHRPCMLQSFDHHACAVNTGAMAAAGFTRHSQDPRGGRIVRDRDGEPTGLLLESAYGAARYAVPEPTQEQWTGFVRAGLADLAVHGFAEVHDLLSQPWLGPVLADLERRGQLPVAVWLYPPLHEAPQVHSTRQDWETDRVKLAGAKVFADGTLNSRTAWMLEPYSDGMPGMERGQAMLTAEELAAAIEETHNLGLGLAVHAIGDGAVRAALDAVEAAPSIRDNRRGMPAVRIEHAEIVDEADVPRFAKLGVVCSVQPCHLLYDIEALQRGLPHRLDRVLPLRDLIDAGCTPGELLWFGSDVPIVRPHPEDSLQAAVARKREGSGPIAPQQAISEHEARRAFGPA